MTSANASEPRASINDLQLRQMIDAARLRLDDFEAGVRLEPDKKNTERGLTGSGLLARARRGTKDGYPTSSLGGGGGSGTVTDRVGSLATADWMEHAPCGGEGCDGCSQGYIHVAGGGDPVRRAGVEFVRHFKRALDELDAAAGELYKVSAVVPPPPVDDLWCSVHVRHGMFEPVGRGGRDGRCQWCYEFRLAEQQDPPHRLLELRAEGVRITSRLVAEHLQKPRRNPARKGPKR